MVTVVVKQRWRAEKLVRSWFKKTGSSKRARLYRYDDESWAAVFDRYIKTISDSHHVVFWGQLFTDWCVEYFKPPTRFAPCKLPEHELASIIVAQLKGKNTIKTYVVDELNAGTIPETIIEKLKDMTTHDYTSFVLSTNKAVKERLQNRGTDYNNVEE